MIIPEIRAKAVTLYGKKAALVCGDLRLTYQDFDRRVNALCNLLRELEIQKDEKVAILHPNCHYFMEAYYAVAQLGAVSVPINYRLSPTDIAFILNDSESSILIADRQFAHLVADALEQGGTKTQMVLWTGTGEHCPLAIESLDYEEELQHASTATCTVDDIQDETVAQLYYTSGTTGRPKGVILTHKNICTHALGAIAELHLTDRDRWIHVAPMFHLADAWATWAITWVGGTHIFVRAFDPSNVL